MVKELNGGHSERSEAESKNPAAVRRGYATGFLDFARNDGHSKASTLQCFNGPSNRSLPQCVIAKNERGHCFDNRHGSSKTGSPSPAGMPRATHSITPPTESPASRICSTSDIIFFAAAASGQRTAFFSTSFIVTVERSIFAVTSWI